MTTPFLDLPLAAFNGITFPVENVKVRGGVRHVVHEYPHSDGGQPEKLGRKLYTIEMMANFQTTFKKHQGGEGDALWPDRLDNLRSQFEISLTAPLLIPTIGEIQAFAVEWDQEASNKILSGEKMTIKFLEDQSEQFLVDNLIKKEAQGAAQEGERLSAAAAEAIRQDLLAPEKQPIFDAITDITNLVVAAADTIDLVGTRLEALLLSLIQLASDAERSVDELNDPGNFILLEQLKRVWAAGQEQFENLKGEQARLITFTLPRQMTVQEVAIEVYGDTSRAVEILQLNPIEDPFAIPAGATLRLYQADPDDAVANNNSGRSAIRSAA